MSRLLAAIVAALLFVGQIEAIELYPSNTALGTITSGVWNGTIIAPTYGGTGAGVLTTGSIPFIGAAGVYSQSNANFFWDNTNKRLGIGTVSPSAALQIGGTGTVRIAGATSGTGTAAIIDANGDIRPLTSSIMFKKNVVRLNFDTELIELLRPVEYDYKESGEHDFGLIAEEVADIYPLMVNYDKSKKPYSVKYQQLSVLLLKKIQEIELRLQELEAGVL
jgi:hypothetical protein